MPRDNAGNFSLPAGYLAITGNDATATQHNAPLEDLAAAMSSSLPVNGTKAMTGPIKVVDGTVSAPGIAFNTDQDTGLYKTTDGFGVAVGGIKVAEFGAGGLISGAVPIGAGTDYWGTAAPAGWLFANGSAISRTTYAKLFDVLSTTYGTGDGSTTFNLPDKRSRVSVASDAMGGTAANRLQTATTISTTDSSTEATVASSAGLSVGMVIDSANVPEGTTVTAISGTTITMSAEATETASDTAAAFKMFADVDALGGTGGSKDHSLTIEQLPAIDLDDYMNDPGHSHTEQGSPVDGGTNTGMQVKLGAGNTGTHNETSPAETDITFDSFGDNQPHPIVQPTIVCNYIIFAGA